MSQPAALPARPARTMLFPVLGSSLLHGPRQARWLRVAVLGVAALGMLLPARAALAQDADDNGWFEQPAADPPPEPYYDEPDANAAPAPAQSQDVPDADPSALTTFRPALDPYGAWVTDSTYGTVWVPNRQVVGEDFAPYVSRGHWALTTDDDWIWQSDYPFGWAVFHYGRWVWISGQGWAWVPGRTYANAWVVWRTPYAGYDYVGWAPMPPTWGWYGGFAFGLWYSPPLPYVFCPSRYVFDYGVHYHIVRDRGMVRDIASHSRVYPTPYHGPANPTARPASVGGARPAAPIGTSAVPRGPAMSAARVPSQAIPASRTLPSANATHLSGSRITSSNYPRQSFTSASDPGLRGFSTRSPSSARSGFTGEPVRRSAPSSSGWSNPRPSSPTWSSYRPSSSPSPVRSAPSSSSSYGPASHSYAPASHSYAPVTHSYAPASHAFAPSFHMHGGGGGGGHRR